MKHAVVLALAILLLAVPASASKVFIDYAAHVKEYSSVSPVPTGAFFYGLREGEETQVEIEQGKTLFIKLVALSEANEKGQRTIFFELNGHPREVTVLDRSLAVEEERRVRDLAEARHANSAEIAALQLRLQAEQDRIGESFVENCTALHQRGMARKEAEWAVDCDVRAQELQAAHAKELRKVSKESGWESELESEVRARVKEELSEQLAEAKLRWEARHRGDAVELDKETAKLTARFEAECEGRVLSAVNAEADRHRVALRDSL